MELKVNIPFNQLLHLVKQLNPAQKQKLQKELVTDTPAKESRSFKEFLLAGPVFSEEQIEVIESTRQSINEWRKK